MEFLLDNPVIAFIFLALLGITVLSIARIVNEVELNKKLRIKQQAMRIAVETQKGFARRLSLLGAQALAPVMVIAFAVLYSPSVTLEPQVPPIIYDSNDSEMYQVFEDDSTLFTLFSSLDGFREVSADSRGNFYPKISYAMILTAEMEFDTAEVAMDDTASPPENGTGSDDYSETNNQVDGVDELDDVLTDGKFIYSMYGSDVQITLAYTQEQGPSVLSNYKTLQYANENFCEEGFFSPTGMYVDDDYFIVLGRQTTFEGDCSEYEQEEYRWYWWWSFSETKALVYDKNNDFELLDEYEFAGDYIGTRKVGNDLYVITRSGINYQYEDFTVQESLPYVDVNGVETKVDAEDVYLMNDENPYYYTTFYGVNLDTKEVDMEVILGESGYTLYSSTENMYLVGTQYYHNEEQVVNDEGDTEIVRVYEHRTMIMRVGINDGDVEYNKIGFVEGFNLNQFSMDEYDNHFRIVTSNQWWGEEINNRLWVLDNDLQVVSVLEHIGKPGERVQSVRFMGEYAYIVTFLQTDPFYVINLSDPANPVKDGELEIPGFSSYLQPLGPDHMLGIGFDANDEGRTTGLKVSIYDISDKNNPTVFDEVIFSYDSFGYVYSDATYNHKDLLVSLEKGLIAMPFNTSGWRNDMWYNRSGIVVLKFDLEDGFEKKMLNNEEVADYEFVMHEENQDYSIYVYKAKFISNYFYTVSNKYIKVSPISDTEAIIDEVQLREIDDTNYYDYGIWGWNWFGFRMWID